MGQINEGKMREALHTNTHCWCGEQGIMVKVLDLRQFMDYDTEDRIHNR